MTSDPSPPPPGMDEPGGSRGGFAPPPPWERPGPPPPPQLGGGGAELEYVDLDEFLREHGLPPPSPPDTPETPERAPGAWGRGGRGAGLDRGGVPGGVWGGSGHTPWCHAPLYCTPLKPRLFVPHPCNPRLFRLFKSRPYKATPL